MSSIGKPGSNETKRTKHRSIFFPATSTNSHLLHFLRLALVTVIYFAAAKLGLSLASINANVSPVWPPTGVAIAAVLLLGYRIWPAILLGAFLANLFTPVPIATAAGIAAGNTLEALSAGVLLRFLDFHRTFDRARDVFKFSVAASLCTMISASLGTLSLCLGQTASWQDFGSLWLTWWLGDTVGALLIAPLLLTWGTEPRPWSTKRYAEAALLLTLLAVSSTATFGGPSPIPLKFYPLARLMVPFFLWAAFRLEQRGVTLATIVVSLFAIWGTAQGVGPFVGRTPNDSLLILQVFLGSNAVMFMFLAATVEERRLVIATLHESERRLAANLAVTRILAESPVLGDATLRILKTIGESLNWEVGAIWTPDEQSGVLRCLNLWHSPSAKVEEFRSVTEAITFAPGTGLPGRVWTTHKPVWIPDVTKEENFPRRPFAIAEGLHSGFAFPIFFGETFLGVMEFFSSEIRRPDDALLATFGSVGNQIGQFILRKRAEEEREQLLSREHAARAEAEAANRAKDEFLAIVSHELRTPLNAVVGWTSLLRGGELEEAVSTRAIEIIDRNARAQAQLIEDLLDVSRIVSGNLRLDLRPVQLDQVIKAAIDSMRPAANAKRIEIFASVDANTSPVSGDPDRLQQMVWNILSNAVKFTPPAGQINVRLTGTSSHIEIVVRDTGEGIRPEFLPRMFDPFRQADSSKTRRHGGLGLGLAIVHRLVELHGGTIKAHSDGEGRGTTFTLILPCVGVSNELMLRQPGQTSLNGDPELVGLRILTVEDDADSREMLEMVLRARGAEVVSVSSVREAVQVLNANGWKPQVLVSDLGMPEEDGYDLIRKLRSRGPEECGELPAIAITGYAGEEESKRALGAGYQTQLAKPVNWNELIKTIVTLARPAH
jgi:signal transduction histidine kinase/integral membrane sensor domain MASE1/ActR/RegA family two-component response regulator